MNLNTENTVPTEDITDRVIMHCRVTGVRMMKVFERAVMTNYMV